MPQSQMPAAQVAKQELARCILRPPPSSLATLLKLARSFLEHFSLAKVLPDELQEEFVASVQLACEATDGR